MLSKFGFSTFKLSRPSSFLLNHGSIKSFASKVAPKKDYYGILGINQSSNLDEIKKAYRALAKKYHPDVSSNEDSSSVAVLNLEKFREVAEAYSVLSNSLTRHNYDRTYSPKPDAVYNSSKMQAMKDAAKERDFTGNTIKDPFDKGGHAEFREEKMKEWRKKYNFDHLGNYKGGIPRKFEYGLRGQASGVPGAPYDNYDHDEEWADRVAMKNVGNFDVVEHKHFMNDFRENNKRFKPYFNMEKREIDEQYETTAEYRNLMRWPVLMLTLLAGFIAFKRISMDSKFRNYKEYIEGLKHYEVDHCGPLLLEAETFKENRKYLSKAEYHRWLDNDIRSFKA